jgi:plastocyanin domain-containing protein
MRSTAPPSRSSSPASCSSRSSSGTSSEKERTAAEVREGGLQQVKVTVKGGYSPDVIVVKQGAPVRLDFYRDETASCTEQVIFGDFGIARDLPAFKTTAVEFTPDKAGEFSFTCGMNMVRGKLIVEAA